MSFNFFFPLQNGLLSGIVSKIPGHRQILWELTERKKTFLLFFFLGTIAKTKEPGGVSSHLVLTCNCVIWANSCELSRHRLLYHGSKGERERD